MAQGTPPSRSEGIEYPNHPPVAEMFPPERLDSIRASELVRGMTPADLHDMEIAFTTLEPSKNPKIGQLKSEDLQSIENLFAEYRQAVIANFTGFPRLESSVRSGHLQLAARAGSSCCCCCTPCCSCSCAATEVHPFEA
jgi:hypothetical protein